MNKYNFELISGIDTLEITSPSYVIGEYPFITHDSSRRITQTDGEEKYRYRFNPNNTLIDVSTFDGYKMAFDYMIKTSGVKSPVKTRIDYCFDTYKGNYSDTFKRDKLLLLLIAIQYDLDNRYESIDMLTAEKKTLRVANQRIEVEAYNKALQEPHGYIKSRLEFRSKKLYDEDAEESKELRELDKWFIRIANSTTSTNFDRLVHELNVNLILRYHEEVSKKSITTSTEFVTKYADFIFSTRQLVDLYRRMGYKNPNSQASKYKKAHKIEFFSLNDMRKFAKAIRNSAALFVETDRAELSQIG